MLRLSFRLTLPLLVTVLMLSGIAVPQTPASRPRSCCATLALADKIAFLMQTMFGLSAAGRRGRAPHVQRPRGSRPVFLPGRHTDRLLRASRGNTTSTSSLRRRATAHHLAPQGSGVVGWTPDGKSLLVASGALSYRHFLKLFLVRADGSGMPEPLPLPRAPRGPSHRWPIHRLQSDTKWEPAGNAMWWSDHAYLDRQSEDSRFAEGARENSNDSNPVWVGDSSTSSPIAPAGDALPL